MAETAPVTRKPIYPPVFFLFALLAMVALHFLFPWKRIASVAVRAAGAIPIALGLALGAWGSNLFRRARTTIKPFETPTMLVTSGPFRLSRNPMYLGMAAVLAGVALLLGSATPWLVIPPFVLLLDLRFIHREEAAMRAAFGETYRAYQDRVRRWL
jgi:protein-S-isoprenylcysteine O-methyltransferase Ste14